MDEIGKMSVEHMFGGVASGIICYLFQSGILPITNEFIGVIISLVLLYCLGKRAENKYGKEKIGFGTWASNGILPFYFIWMVVWIIAINYLL
ncbi:MAG: hypothetical protein E7Z84_04055 [Methanosphaera stadtmanae]|nr:hypothetical protein [Methanosphaera stadtmanae]